MMGSVERGYRNATRTLGVATAAIGLCLLIVTIARGGGPLAVGSVLGVAFLVLGAGRVYLASRSGNRP
jgi:hypothetical protein